MKLKILKNKKIIISILLLIIGSLAINYTFFKPTKINFYIASKLYKTPANTAFTDDNFYKCVVDAYNEENNTNINYTTKLTEEQLKNIKSLSCVGYDKSDEQKINSVNGIEKLTSLEHLGIGWNNLETMDLSNNINLKELSAGASGIKYLNITNNHNLESIYLEENELTNIDLSNNPKLEYVHLGKNNLENIDVSQNINIERLYLSFNNLNNIDLSKNINLTSLSLTFNNITEIELSQHTNLTYLELWNNNLNSIDLSNNKQLYSINLSNNRIEQIDLPSDTKLIELDLYNNELTEINLKNSPHLVELDISRNNLENVDLSNNTKLKTLILGDNQLADIDLNNNNLLESVSLELNKLTELNVSSNINLKKLDIRDNDINNLDLSHNIELISLDLYGNPLSNLDLSKNTNLQDFYGATIIPRENIAVYLGDTLIFEERADRYFIPPKTFELEIFESASARQKGTEMHIGPIKNNYQLNNLLVWKPGVYYLWTRFSYHSVRYDLYLIEATSTKYNINPEEDWIYVKNDNVERNLLNNIDINYGEESIENNKYIIKYDNKAVKEFDIFYIDFGNLEVNNNFIVIDEDLSYDDFKNSINLSDKLNYKIYNNETEITCDQIIPGMSLKIYHGDQVIDTYKITDEFLDLSLLTIDEENLLIKDLKLGTTISSFKENILTSGSVKILDQDGEELKDTDLVRSGAKVVIELSKDTYEYTLSVKGDVTGTGKSTVSDVGKLYQYLRKKTPMDKCYIEAGNVIDTDNEIKITDVGKLYQFIKGKIDSLED